MDHDFRYDAKFIFDGEMAKRFNFFLTSSGGIISISEVHQEFSEKVFEIYSQFMENFNLPFCFYPYSKIMQSSNCVFGRKNPAMRITVGNEVVEVVRKLNFGLIFINVDLLRFVRFNTSLKYAFIDDFANSLFQSGLIPSSSLFLNPPIIETLHPELSYNGDFELRFSSEYQEELAKLKLTADNSVSPVIDHLKKIKGMS